MSELRRNLLSHVGHCPALPIAVYGDLLTACRLWYVVDDPLSIAGNNIRHRNNIGEEQKGHRTVPAYLGTAKLCTICTRAGNMAIDIATSPIDKQLPPPLEVVSGLMCASRLPILEPHH